MNTNLTNKINSLYDTTINVPGTAYAAAQDTTDILYNGVVYGFSKNLTIPANNNLTCTLGFNNMYYVRLQKWNISDIKNIFPRAATINTGELIQNIFCMVKRDTTNEILIPNTFIIKENGTTATLISQNWSADTSKQISTSYRYTILLRTTGTHFVFRNPGTS